MTKHRNPTILCEKHKGEIMRPLKYQKHGSKVPTWHIAEGWYYCEKCARPQRVEISIRVVETA